MFTRHETENGESYLLGMLTKGSETNIMRDLEEIIAECERNAPADDEIDYSQIPPITDFSGAKPLGFSVQTKDQVLAVDCVPLH